MSVVLTDFFTCDNKDIAFEQLIRQMVVQDQDGNVGLRVFSTGGATNAAICTPYSVTLTAGANSIAHNLGAGYVVVGITLFDNSTPPEAQPTPDWNRVDDDNINIDWLGPNLTGTLYVFYINS